MLTLRRFRDETLQKTRLGRLFIRMYYRLSPAAAEKLRRAEKLNSVVRAGPDRLVHALESRR